VSRGHSPIVRRRRLGAELRRLREAVGLTGEQVIARVGWASASKLSRLENGRSRPDVADIFDLLDVYGVTGPERDALVAVARDAGNRGWIREYAVMTDRQRKYAELESGCVHIREYAPAIVPGLLQTPGYTRVRIHSSRALAAHDATDPAPSATRMRRATRPSPASRPGASVQSLSGRGDRQVDPEAEVAARLARQAILTRAIDPPQYEAVLDEAALGPRGGPPDVIREQLTHLATLAQLPNVTLRVLPRDATIGEWYLPHTGFSLYRFADPADPETAAVEALANDLILTEKPDIARYTHVFTWLRAAALSPELSYNWLAGAAHEAPENAGRRSAPGAGAG
jgi:transcriptional regulator with XRE-family HTH domain